MDYPFEGIPELFLSQESVHECSVPTLYMAIKEQIANTTDSERFGRPGSLESRIMSFLDEIISREDWFIVDVSVRGGKGSRVVEVYMDGDEGISITDMAKLSRELSFLLDAEDIIKGKYLLNVSSPGDERALLLERQYQRHTGKTLEVLVNREEGPIWLEGENLGVKDGVLTLKVASLSQEIPLNGISKARIKLPW